MPEATRRRISNVLNARFRPIIFTVIYLSCFVHFFRIIKWAYRKGQTNNMRKGFALIGFIMIFSLQGIARGK
jgi:hypothetical protein